MIPLAATAIVFLSLLGASGYVYQDRLNNLVQQVLHPAANQQQPTIEDFILLRQFSSIELMLHKGAPITLEHYRKLAFMEKLESNPQKKAAIVATLHLVEHYLQEQGILPKENLSRMKRPVLTAAAAAAAASSGPEGQEVRTRDVNVKFFEAVKENDIPLMEQLAIQGANPDCRIDFLQPLEIAIAQGHVEATAWLLSKPVTVTTHHTESSQRFAYIIQSNFQEKFSNDQEVIDKAELEQTRLRFAIKTGRITPETYQACKKRIQAKLTQDLSRNHLDLTFTTAATEDDTYEQKIGMQKAAYQTELSKRAHITSMLQQHISRRNRK